MKEQFKYCFFPPGFEEATHPPHVQQPAGASPQGPPPPGQDPDAAPQPDLRDQPQRPGAALHADRAQPQLQQADKRQAAPRRLQEDARPGDPGPVGQRPAHLPAGSPPQPAPAGDQEQPAELCAGRLADRHDQAAEARPQRQPAQAELRLPGSLDGAQRADGGWVSVGRCAEGKKKIK